MRKLLILLVLCLGINHAFSQNRTVKGKVLDEKGAPVSGASIQAKGTKIGTVSSDDGSFAISVPSSSTTLVITSVNFTAQEVAVGDNLSITLKGTTGNLSEVLVVAYGQVKKTNLTGSLVTVKAGEVEDKPFTSVDKALQGAVAGLQSSSSSGAPGAATDIRIRGIGSITADANPLWVIDGAVATTGDLSTQTTTANALSSLNPDDIESITVLKDAATASIYGSRAANGVILVTTKKAKAGKTSINFSSENGSSSFAFKPTNKPLSTLETQTLLRQSLINAGYATDNTSADAIITDPNNGLGIDPDYTKTNTNWLNVVSRTGSQYQDNLSISGGDGKTQYYASGGLFNQVGTTLASDFKRYNGNLSITHKANDRFTFSAGLNGSTSNQNTPNNSGYFANPQLAQFFLLPWYSPYNSDGSYKYNDPQNQFSLGGGIYNPVVQAAWNKYNLKQTVIRGNVSGEYKILDNVKFTSRYSGEYFDISEDQYLNPLYGDGYGTQGSSNSSYKRIYDWTWSNFADYKQTLNKAQDVYFDLKAGYEAYQQNVYILQAGGNKFPSTLALQYLASAATPTVAFSDVNSNTTNSLFSVADVNYKDRYVVSGSYRRDASSRFGANHKWANFYSVGGAWNINEEEFLKNSKLISLLKLRSSYGQNGNQSIGNYTALATFGFGNNYTGNPGSALNNVGNPDLTWEKNAIFNVGVDFGLFKNRLYGTVEYYSRNTTNLLLGVPLSLTAGVPNGTQNRNVGAMTNKGYEITLGGKPIVTKDFSWDVSVNLSHNTNKVTALYLNNPVPYGPFGQFNITVGHDIQEYYMQQWAGVNTTDGTPLWYTDGTHTKTTGKYGEAAPSLSGKSASPKYFGSFNNTFSYKGLSLQVQLYYNFGNYIDDIWGSYNSSDGAYLGIFNQTTDELAAWQKPGDITNTPKIVYGGNNNSFYTSTRFVYKGDYIRLRNVDLSYAIPKPLLKKAHIASLLLYIRGTNLLTLGADKHLPFDPEAGVTSEGNLNVYLPKTITGGIKIGL